MVSARSRAAPILAAGTAWTGTTLGLALTEITLIHPDGLANRRDLCTDYGFTIRVSQVRRTCRNVTDVARRLSNSRSPTR